MFVFLLCKVNAMLRVMTSFLFFVKIDLLLGYATKDTRKSINLIAVNNLHMLARSAPHLWTSQHVQVP